MQSCIQHQSECNLVFTGKVGLLSNDPLLHSLDRRGFVPPIKRDQQDEGGSNFGEEVHSRVFYGGAKGSSKGSSGHQLPPELEGDERLRNIEPRMVELITNEVRIELL